MRVQEVKAWMAEDGRVFTEKGKAETHNKKIGELVKLVNAEIGGNWYLENIISEFILGNQKELLNILKPLAEGTEYVTYSNEIEDDEFIGGFKNYLKEMDRGSGGTAIELADVLADIENYYEEEVNNMAEEALKLGMQRIEELPVIKIGTVKASDVFKAENVCSCKCKRKQLK